MSSLLGYWNIRGLGQSIRMFLNYVGEEFEDKRYPYVREGEGVGWYKEKFSLGLDFPNLPYYRDGATKLTQSRAIMKYIGRKYGLVAETEEQKQRGDLLAAEYTDFITGFIGLCYNPEFEKLKDDYGKKVAVKLAQFDAFLGERPWFVGPKMTWLDFCMYEALDHHLCCWPSLLQNFPKLALFMTRFEAVPQNKAFMSSPAFIKRPLYTPSAFFG